MDISEEKPVIIIKTEDLEKFRIYSNPIGGNGVSPKYGRKLLELYKDKNISAIELTPNKKWRKENPLDFEYDYFNYSRKENSWWRLKKGGERVYIEIRLDDKPLNYYQKQ